MRDPHPGQDEEAHIVHHVVEISLPGRLIPADEGVSGCGFPGGGAPAQASHDPAVQVGQVFEIGPDNQRPAQVVMPAHQLVPEALLGGLADHGECQRAEVGDLPLYGGGVDEKALFGDSLFAAGSGISSLGQLDFALSVQGEQQVPAGSVLEPAVGLSPVPMSAKGLGNLGTAFIPVLSDELMDSLQFF